MERARSYVFAQYEQARSWTDAYRLQVEALLCPQSGAHPDGAQSDHLPSLNLVSTFEPLLVHLQTLLLWENPLHTSSALLSFTCFYALFILWSPPPITALAYLILVYYAYESWTLYVWPEIRVPTAVKEKWTTVSPNVLSAPEIEAYLGSGRRVVCRLLSDLTDLRRRSHGTFSFLSVFLLVVVYYLGKYIHGAVLVYCAVMLLFLTPGFLLYVLPRHSLDELIDYANSLVTPGSTLSEGQVSESSTLICEEASLSKSDLALEPEVTPSSGANRREGSISPPHHSHFYDTFFAPRDTTPPTAPARTQSTGSSSSSSELLDDYEVIDDEDLGEMAL